jgi:glycosyltransferase involved in cell wall biosynthesis
MQNPLVSVLVPCYNVSAYVVNAIQSILDQTYTNLEVLIIDDASTDDTLRKIKSFNDSRIRVIEFKDNTKKIGAVNKVLKQVNGVFICFQDSDDWSQPNRIEKQVNQFINNKELGICFTAYTIIGEKKNTPSPISLSNEDLRDEFIDFGHKKNIHFHPTCCPSMMISKEVLHDFCGYDYYFSGRVGEDIHWIYRILKKFQGVTINELLYNYTIRIDSLTGNQFLGTNPQAAYAWNLLSLIIYKDIYEKIDVLNAKFYHLLKELELKACEEALIESIQLYNSTKYNYEKSHSYRLGNFLLAPIRSLKNAIGKLLH